MGSMADGSMAHGSMALVRWLWFDGFGSMALVRWLMVRWLMARWLMVRWFDGSMAEPRADMAGCHGEQLVPLFLLKAVQTGRKGTIFSSILKNTADLRLFSPNSGNKCSLSPHERPCREP
jgi:hypothetical protein